MLSWALIADISIVKILFAIYSTANAKLNLLYRNYKFIYFATYCTKSTLSLFLHFITISTIMGLGTVIKKIREQKGLLQKQVAIDLGIGHTNYNKIVSLL